MGSLRGVSPASAARTARMACCVTLRSEPSTTATHEQLSDRSSSVRGMARISRAKGVRNLLRREAFILDEQASDPGNRCVRGLANDTADVLAIAASQHCVVTVRVHARICPPWAFPSRLRAEPFFWRMSGSVRPRRSVHRANFPISMQIVSVPLQDRAVCSDLSNAL